MELILIHIGVRSLDSAALVPPNHGYEVDLAYVAKRSSQRQQPIVTAKILPANLQKPPVTELLHTRDLRIESDSISQRLAIVNMTTYIPFEILIYILSFKRIMRGRAIFRKSKSHVREAVHSQGALHPESVKHPSWSGKATLVPL